MERVEPPKGYVLTSKHALTEILAVEAELLRSEGIDPHGPALPKPPKSRSAQSRSRSGNPAQLEALTRGSNRRPRGRWVVPLRPRAPTLAFVQKRQRGRGVGLARVARQARTTDTSTRGLLPD